MMIKGEMIEHGIIIKGVGGLYFVQTPLNTYSCRARGLFKLHGQTPLVGDRVVISVVDAVKNEGYLLEIKERKNELIRPRVANVDLNIIVVSAAKPRLSFEMLDSLLVYSEMQGLEAAICVNKTDIAEEAAVSEITRIYEAPGYKVFRTCGLDGSGGLDGLAEYITGKTVILSGPSGTGKTSLLNLIMPGHDFKTGTLSRKTQRGAHTTRHAEFLQLNETTFICDTPGFTSFNIDMIDKRELRNYYPEFAELNGKCYYNNCLHISEHDCAIKEQIGVLIGKDRYDRYVRFVTMGL